MKIPKAKTAMALIDEMAARHPEREAVLGSNVRYSWAEFRVAVRDLAKGLHAAGVQHGDKVAILMGNRPEWLIADFAIMALGGVMVAHRRRSMVPGQSRVRKWPGGMCQPPLPYQMAVK